MLQKKDLNVLSYLPWSSRFDTIAVLCRFGWHKWSFWEAPQREFLEFHLRHGIMQRRTCLGCGKAKTREVR